MATPPTRIAGAKSAMNSTATPKTTTTSLTLAVDDVLVLMAGAAGPGTGIPSATISNSAGSITWTSQQSRAAAGYGDVRLWTGVVTAAGTSTITVSGVTGGQWWGFAVTQWRGVSGIGTSGVAFADPGAPSLTLTGVAANSAVESVSTDFAAQTGTITWRSINGAAMTLEASIQNGNQYSMYMGYRDDVGSGGSVTVGTTAPTGQTYSILGVELLGTSSSVPATVTAVPATATAEGEVPTVGGGATVQGVAGTATALALAVTLAAGAVIVAPTATATAAAPVPTVAVGGTVAAVRAQATASAQAPAVTAGGTVAAVRGQAAAAAPAPTVAGGAVVAVTRATAAAAAPAPTVGISASITAVTATATALARTPAVTGAAALAAPAATATAAAPAPSVSAATGSTVSAVPGTAAAAARTPTVTAGATVVAPLATATAAARVPTVAAGGTVQAIRGQATAAAPAPAITAGAVLQAAVATGTASAPPPTVGAGSIATVQAVTATATALARPPAVTAGASVLAARATATAAARVPLISVAAVTYVPRAQASATALPATVFGQDIGGAVLGGTALAPRWRVTELLLPDWRAIPLQDYKITPLAERWAAKPLAGRWHITPEVDMTVEVLATAGAVKFVGGTVQELNGMDISGSTYKMSLGSATDPGTTWVDPDQNTQGANNSQRVLKLKVSATLPAGIVVPGTYWVWARITDSQEIEPVRLQGPIVVR